MKVTRILAALALVACFAGTASAQHGCARLSWGTCDPWTPDHTFGAAGPYLMVYSIFGSPDGNVGTDSQVRIRHLAADGSQAPVPDAWRFDDSGCQTGSQLALNNNALNKLTCPSYKGTNPLTITQYAIDLDGSAFLRLAITYDNFQPVATTRYTVWQITFDHTFSNIGPSVPGATCGGAEQCENFSFDFAGVLGLTGIQYNIPDCDVTPAGLPSGTEATWNGGCQGPVATVPATWGKVKGMYRN